MTSTSKCVEVWKGLDNEVLLYVEREGDRLKVEVGASLQRALKAK